MQPPRADRRPGFSRRRQTALFAGQVAAIVGIVAGLVLILLARVSPAAFNAMRGGALDLTAPVAGALRDGLDRTRGLADAAGDYLSAGSQNAALKQQVAADQRALAAARADAFELRRLKALLRVSEPPVQAVAVARLVASTGSGPRREATLTAGRLQGVRTGQPVRAAEGLVGRVIETGAIAARVMLLTDEGNVVPVRVTRDGTPALVSGTGEGALDVKALAAGGTPFRRGDLLVTSGTGGLYPPDVPVAVITQAAGDSAVAWPLARPDRLDFALVEPIYQTDLSASPAAKAAR